MKLSIAVVLMLFSGMAAAQTRKPIDWSECQKITDQFKATVEKFNSEHKDGFSLELGCTYSGSPTQVKQPQQKVWLTPSETNHLHELRTEERAVLDEMEEYESYLFSAHHLRRPSIGEPCYYFAGIVVDTDYITVDPNPMSVEDDCGLIQWKLAGHATPTGGK